MGMKDRFKDQLHLIRMGLLFVGGLVVFLVVRGVVIPADFGVYGHYRASALADSRARPLQYAGRTACGECHGDVVQVRIGSGHEKVGCEACHGPLAVHAADPAQLEPILPEPSVCLVCHRDNVAKSKGFPQVDPEEHAGSDACTDCHLPHHPEVS
jgi:uncharacterized CHY-type Zn-finger protein